MAEQKTAESSEVTPEELQRLRSEVEKEDEENKLQKLRSDLEKVTEEIHQAMESNLRPGIDRDDVDKISEELKKIKLRVTRQDDGKKGGGDDEHRPQDHQDDGKKGGDDKHQLLPKSKREELETLLGCIRRAMRPPRKPESEPPLQKKLLSATTGCNPFKPRASSQQSKQQAGGGGEGGGQEGEGEEDDGEEGVSMKLLLRLARQVQEPEEYYEWTTSYVDESRIYGWDKEADEVVKALVGPKDGDFRAAAITGVHGSGKTALAQKAFVHDLVKDHFPLRLWVCVGPPDSEDRFGLLYRMLDNLGLDTNKIEDVVVDGAKVVKDARKSAEEEMKNMSEEERKKLWSEAAKLAAAREKVKKKETGVKGEQSQVKPDDVKDASQGQKPDDVKDAPQGQVKPDDVKDAPQGQVKPDNVKDDTKKQEEGTDKDAQGQKPASEDDVKERIYQELLKEKIENSDTVRTSKYGVLLYILHLTLAKTGYLIVFDDIRVYGTDGWYNNLTLPPPAEPDKEWGDRLAYGLPKTGKHRSAVLVTCRKEDDAKAMVRAGRVFHPPKLKEDDGWKLFTREYEQAKKQKQKKDSGGAEGGEWKEEDDPLFKELKEMKEEIVNKCLGLPVAIIEAAKGFALSDLKPLPDPVVEKPAAEAKTLQEETKLASEDQVGSSNKETQGEDAAQDA